VKSRSIVLIDNAFRRFPVLIAVGYAAVRYTVADGLVQISELRRDWINWDYPRSMAFLTFGLWSGVFWGNLYGRYYGPLMEKLVRRGMSRRRVALGIAFFDTTIVTGVAYYPAYYLVQEYCHTRRFSPAIALRKAKKNCMVDITVVTMYYVPMT